MLPLFPNSLFSYFTGALSSSVLTTEESTYFLNMESGSSVVILDDSQNLSGIYLRMLVNCRLQLLLCVLDIPILWKCIVDIIEIISEK
jgi:hypothetical protein